MSEKETTWMISRDTGLSLLGYLGYILRESYNTEKMILKANKSNWDWLEVLSLSICFYGWQRSQMSTERKVIYRCHKCKTIEKENQCVKCGHECDRNIYTNGVYVLEPIGALMALREGMQKDSHAKQVIEVLLKSKELQSNLDRLLLKRDTVEALHVK